MNTIELLLNALAHKYNLEIKTDSTYLIGQYELKYKKRPIIHLYIDYSYYIFYGNIKNGKIDLNSEQSIEKLENAIKETTKTIEDADNEHH